MSRDPINYGVYPNLSPKKSRARELKFGIQMHRGNISKTREEKNIEKRRGLCQVTPIYFGVHPNVSPK